MMSWKQIAGVAFKTVERTEKKIIPKPCHLRAVRNARKWMCHDLRAAHIAKHPAMQKLGSE